MPGIRLSTLVRRLRRDARPADGCSDADLLARFGHSRDNAAFELLVWRHGAMVLGACQRILAHPEDAEDAFQATFLVLARKAAGISRGVALPAWLHRVAVRLARRLARSRRAVASLQAEPAAPTRSDRLEEAEALAVLDEEVDRLPERQRRAVVLCYLEGLTAAEAGRQLGCPTGTVESRLAAARRRLRERLTRRGVTLPAGAAAIGGSVALAPEVAARVVRAGVAFARQGAKAAAQVVREPSIQLAKGVLTMWNLRTGIGMLIVSLAVAATTGVVWAERDQPAVPREETAAKAQLPAEEPQTAPPPAEKGQKPTTPATDASAWPLARQIGGHQGELVGISADSRYLIAIHPNGRAVYGLDLTKTDDSIDQTFYIGSQNAIAAAAVSPDGKYVATAEGKDGAKLRELATGKVLDALWPSEGVPAQQVAFNSDGSRLVVLCSGLFGKRPVPGAAQQLLSFRAQVSVWDVTSRKELGHSVESITTISPEMPEYKLSPNGRFVLKWVRPRTVKAASSSQRFEVIDASTSIAGQSFELHGTPPYPHPISPDGKTIALVNNKFADRKEVRLIDITTGKERAVLSPLRRNLSVFTFSPDGRYAAGATEIGGDQDLAAPSEVVIWDAATGKEIVRLIDKETTRDYSALYFSPDGSFLVAQDGRNEGSGHLTIWGRLPQPRASRPATETKPSPGVAAANASPDRFQALIRDSAADGVADARRVEVLFLAALGRLPTDVESRTLTAQLAKQTDKAAALRDLLNTLVDTAEFKAHAAALQQLAK